MFKRLAHVRDETRVGRAALSVMHARLHEAQRAVDGEMNVAGVFVFLAVIFPPAHRAQQECARRFKSAESATRAAVIGVHSRGWTAMRASGLHPGPELPVEPDLSTPPNAQDGTGNTPGCFGPVMTGRVETPEGGKVESGAREKSG